MQTEIIKNRLGKLLSNTQPEFGIMTAQHMIEHLILTIKLSYGRVTIPDFEPNEKQLAQKNALINSDMLFPKGIKAPGLPDQLMDLKYPNLDSAIEQLLKSISEYHRTFNEEKSLTTTHPRFGKLTYDEWEKFHSKHFEHHFGQFGI